MEPRAGATQLCNATVCACVGVIMEQSEPFLESIQKVERAGQHPQEGWREGAAWCRAAGFLDVTGELYKGSTSHDHHRLRFGIHKRAETTKMFVETVPYLM
jgi:hypothetical protein